MPPRCALSPVAGERVRRARRMRRSPVCIPPQAPHSIPTSQCARSSAFVRPRTVAPLGTRLTRLASRPGSAGACEDDRMIGAHEGETGEVGGSRRKQGSGGGSTALCARECVARTSRREGAPCRCTPGALRSSPAPSGVMSAPARPRRSGTTSGSEPGSAPELRRTNVAVGAWPASAAAGGAAAARPFRTARSTTAEYEKSVAMPVRLSARQARQGRAAQHFCAAVAPAERLMGVEPV